MLLYPALSAAALDATIYHLFSFRYPPASPIQLVLKLLAFQVNLISHGFNMT